MDFPLGEASLARPPTASVLLVRCEMAAWAPGSRPVVSGRSCWDLGGECAEGSAGVVRAIELPGGQWTRGKHFPITWPEIRRDYPLNLSILVSGGKETNKDSPSNGE